MVHADIDQGKAADPGPVVKKPTTPTVLESEPKSNDQTKPGKKEIVPAPRTDTL